MSRNFEVGVFNLHAWEEPKVLSGRERLRRKKKKSASKPEFKLYMQQICMNQIN